MLTNRILSCIGHQRLSGARRMRMRRLFQKFVPARRHHATPFPANCPSDRGGRLHSHVGICGAKSLHAKGGGKEGKKKKERKGV